MRYLFLSSIVWDGYRGHPQELTLALAKRGHDCVFINPIRYRNWQEASIRLQKLSGTATDRVNVIERYSGLSKSFLLLLYENIQNLICIWKHRPEAVVCFDYLMGVLPCVFCKLTGVRFVYSVMDDWEEIEKSPLVKIYLRYISKPILGRFSFAVSATSHKQAEVFGRLNSNIFLIPNGKPDDFIVRANQIGNNEGVREGTVNFISTLRDWYDFDLLFDVFKEFPEIQLNVYGKGDLYDYLLERCEAYPNISMKGNADPEQVPVLTAQSLFGILPLKMNKLNDSTSPIKLFDYWSAQKAVIASPTFELKEMGGKGGIIYATSKEQYVNEIRKFLGDRLYMRSVGKCGYQNMVEQYNYEKISARFENILN